MFMKPQRTSQLTPSPGPKLYGDKSLTEGRKIEKYTAEKGL